MHPRRRSAAIRPLVVLPALALAGAVSLTACTSSSAPAARTSSTRATGQPAAAATGGHAVDPTTVATTLQRGLAGATSARLTVSTVLSGQTLKGAGDLALSRGTITRADLQQDLPSGLGTITVVVAGGKTYAKLPTALRGGSGKPWVVLSTGSSSAVVSQLAAIVAPVLTVASPASLVAFTRAASSVTDLGPAAVGGVATTHYRVVVPAATLPTSVPRSITAGGKPSIPIDMYLDGSGRPHQVVSTFAISGQTVTPTIGLSNYDAPVSITAPPAAQVGNG